MHSSAQHKPRKGLPNGGPKIFFGPDGPHSLEEQTMLKSPIVPLLDSHDYHLNTDELWLDADDLRLQCGVITPYEASLDSDQQEKAWH